MATRKGKKYADKKTKQTYWSEGRRIKNKIRRITRCNGLAFLAQWQSKYGRV